MIKNSVKYFRESKNLSQENLAKAIGVSRQTIVALEKGSYNPSLELSFRLSMELGVPIIELFQWEEES